MNRVLALAAVGEAGTGLALVLAPSLVAQLLLGADVTGSGVVVARVAGIALIALAAACWPGPAALGMLFYGLLVTLYLGWMGATGTASGVLLWPAVVLHAVLTALLTHALLRPKHRAVPKENDR